MAQPPLIARLRGRFDAAVAVPVAAAALLYARAPALGFAWDDSLDVLRNRFVTGPLNVAGIFTSEYLGGLGPVASGHYRPLLNLTYKLIATIFGLRPGPFHAVNVLVFLALVGLTVLLARALSADRAVAMAAGLIFAVHPIAVESVAAIVGLKETASLLLACLSLGLYIRWRVADGFAEAPASWAGGAWAAAAMLAALLYKETALAWIALAAASEFLHPQAPKPRGAASALRRLAPLAPIAVSALLVFAARAAVTGGLYQPSAVHSVENPLVALSGASRKLAAASLAGRAFSLWVWPSRLCVDHGLGSFPLARSAADPMFLFSLLLASGAIAGLAAALRRGSRFTAFAIVAVGAAWLPSSNLLLTIGTILAERFLLAPSWGLSLLAGLALAGIARRLGRSERSRAAVLAALLAVIALPLAARSWTRIGDWRDNESLVASGLASSPGNLKLCAAAALQAEERGEADRALAAFEQLLAERPDSPYAQAQLGSFLFRRGEYDRAEPLLAASASSSEPLPTAIASLALLYLRTDRPEAAFEAAGRLLASRPSFSEAAAAHIIRGEVQVGRGRNVEAETEYRLAVEADPDNAMARYNLAAVLEAGKDLAGAIVQYSAADRLRPDDPDVLYSLSVAQMKAGRSEDSLETIDRLLAITPASLRALEHRLVLLHGTGRLEEAAVAARLLLEKAPDNGTAHLLLGSLAEKEANPAEARRHYQALLDRTDLTAEMRQDINRRLESLGG